MRDIETDRGPSSTGGAIPLDFNVGDEPRAILMTNISFGASVDISPCYGFIYFISLALMSHDRPGRPSSDSGPKTFLRIRHAAGPV